MLGWIAPVVSFSPSVMVAAVSGTPPWSSSGWEHAASVSDDDAIPIRKMVCFTALFHAADMRVIGEPWTAGCVPA